jgi:hypothetical protein
MTVIEQLQDADKMLAANGYQSWCYVRLAISEAIKALSKPPVISTIGDMLYFIESIRATDKYISEIYLHGGCYQFHILLKKFAPESEPRITKKKDHIVTLFKGKYFDIRGIVDGQFYTPTTEDIDAASSWSFADNMALQIGECPACGEPICY